MAGLRRIRTKGLLPNNKGSGDKSKKDKDSGNRDKNKEMDKSKGKTGDNPMSPTKLHGNVMYSI